MLTPGFAVRAGAIARQGGRCLAPAGRNPAGGLLVRRRVDSVTAFSDGSQA